MSDDECYEEHEEYDKWSDENDDELWAIYHEQGANYDQNYEDWCEKRYEDMVYCCACKYKHYPRNPRDRGWCYMFKEKPKPECLKRAKRDQPAGGSRPN